MHKHVHVFKRKKGVLFPGKMVGDPAKLKVKSYAVAVTDARRCSPFDNAFLFYIM